MEYTYDSCGRVTQIRRSQLVYGQLQEDLCQRTDLTYDSAPYDPSFQAENTWGRLAEVQYGGVTCTPGQFVQRYSYTTGGLQTRKRLRLSRQFEGQTSSADLEATASWNTDAQMTSITYFWGQGADDQGFTLAHEALHIMFNNDNDLQFARTFANYKGDAAGASEAIAKWLKGNCE